MKFQTSKIELLKVLRDLVTENIGFKDVNAVLESEVGEFITEISDKRRYRRLKLVKRSLDKLIDETIREEKLRREERLYNEAKMKEAMENAARRSNDHQ